MTREEFWKLPDNAARAAAWEKMSKIERETARDLPTAHVLWPLYSPERRTRVEVETEHGEKRRFYLGLSTGWIPVLLEIKTARSMGGGPCDRTYKSVRVVREERR